MSDDPFFECWDFSSFAVYENGELAREYSGPDASGTLQFDNDEDTFLSFAFILVPPLDILEWEAQTGRDLTENLIQTRFDTVTPPEPDDALNGRAAYAIQDGSGPSGDVVAIGLSDVFFGANFVRLFSSDPNFTFPPNLDDPSLVTGSFDRFLPFCFAAGTLISTPNGETRVEDLAIGDLILNLHGVPVPVKWIGTQTVSPILVPSQDAVFVRFAKHSLGFNVPHTDLRVTCDHAVLLDGVLCSAGALVNGTTIRLEPAARPLEFYTIYHVETENHDVVLANNVPAETFMDYHSRKLFDNFAEYETLYGSAPEMRELPYPRATTSRVIPTSVRAKIDVDAKVLSHRS